MSGKVSSGGDLMTLLTDQCERGVRFETNNPDLVRGAAYNLSARDVKQNDLYRQSVDTGPLFARIIQFSRTRHCEQY